VIKLMQLLLPCSLIHSYCRLYVLQHTVHGHCPQWWIAPCSQALLTYPKPPCLPFLLLISCLQLPSDCISRPHSQPILVARKRQS
jgi:hypothetical protein